MSYNEIVKLRDLFAQDTLGLVNRTQRLILTMIISHESTDLGCIVGFDKLMEYNLLKKSALLENLHYLGDGKSWKQGAYTDCTNPDCSQHLDIVKTQHYAKRGWQQVYRTDLRAYELALRVRAGGPIEQERVHVENLKAPPRQQKVSVKVDPYKHEIQERQLQSSYVDLIQNLIDKHLPKKKQFILDTETQTLCLELEHLETPFNAFAEYLSALSQDSIISPSAYVKSRLQALKEATPALVAERKLRDEQEKIYSEQLQETQRNKLTGDLLDERIKQARRALGK